MIGDNFKAKREALGMTQIELAGHLLVGQSMAVSGGGWNQDADGMYGQDGRRSVQMHHGRADLRRGADRPGECIKNRPHQGRRSHRGGPHLEQGRIRWPWRRPGQWGYSSWRGTGSRRSGYFFPVL